MQFANQAISLFISGIFCLVWLSIMAWSFIDQSSINFLKAYFFNKEMEPITTIGFTFFVFPLAYAIGSAVNTIANRLFDKMDDKIRFVIFKSFLDYEEIESKINELNIKSSISKDTYKQIEYDLNNESSTDLSKVLQLIYHHYRLKIYNEGEELYNYLFFHREIIRILRATCFNFFFIFLSLITFTGCWFYKGVGYLFILLILFNVLLVKESFWGNIFRHLFKKNHQIWFLIFSILVNYFLCIFYPIRNNLFLFAFPFTLFISFICFVAWEKKQEDYYKTIINVKQTMKS
jgi:hypothetical protein